MKKLHGILWALALTASALTQVGFAADKQPPAAAKPDAAPNVQAAWDRRIPVFEIDGLPLVEVVRHLRDLYPELNFLIRRLPSSESESVDIEGISIKAKLRNVTLPEILKATELASDHPIRINATPEDRLIVFERAEKSAAADKPPIVTRAYNLSEYLGGLSPQQANDALTDIHDVIRMTARQKHELAGGPRIAPTLQYHPGTKLFVAIGRPDEVEIVDQIASQFIHARGGQVTRPASTIPSAGNAGAPPPARIR